MEPIGSILIASSIVVSNDTISKIIRINKNTKMENFYQQRINKFPPSDNYDFRLFYYEGYSHKKQYVTKEEEYVIANKKGIEYFYFCSNNDANININDIDLDMDYLKYYSVIIFSPIILLNNEYQNNQRKKMQMMPINNYNIVNPMKMWLNNQNNIFENHIPEYETIDTETDPLNKYVENALILSHAMKKLILKEKKIHPENFIDISMILSSPGLLSNVQPSISDYNYILCLIGKILENNGIIVGIYKQNYNKDRVDLSCIQFLFSGLINKKKFRLLFYVNQHTINLVINDLNYRKEFINKWKENIAHRLNIDKKYLILTNPRQRKYLYLDLAFNPNMRIINHELLIKLLVFNEIKSCEMIPLLEGCRLSPSIFDIRFHKFYSYNFNNNFINQIRGGEEYISPLSWTAYGINISDKYDFGDNSWLGNKNGIGEFAVAYYGINNILNCNIQNLTGLAGNYESGKTFMDIKNIRNPVQKCHKGVYFFKNPIHAENSSEIINIGGFEYKIMFMCRINPHKIRQPENFQDCWILSPTPDEVRPYKILIKKIPISPIAIASQQEIKLCLKQPNPIYFQILKEKDESFFNKKSFEFKNLSNYDYVLKLYSQNPFINSFLREPYNQNGQNNLFLPPIQYNNVNDKKSFVWCLHKAVTQNFPTIPNGTILYRGVCFKLPFNIGIGTKFYFPEFLSTSRDINIAKDIAGNGTLMIINVQNNGTDGNKVYCRDIEYISDYPYQKEILFTSHCQFRITKIERTFPLDYLYLICEGHHFLV